MRVIPTVYYLFIRNEGSILVMTVVLFGGLATTVAFLSSTMPGPIIQVCTTYNTKSPTCLLYTSDAADE